LRAWLHDHVVPSFGDVALPSTRRSCGAAPSCTFQIRAPTATA
jgi:hypothetical protein